MKTLLFAVLWSATVAAIGLALKLTSLIGAAPGRMLCVPDPQYPEPCGCPFWDPNCNEC